MLRKLLLCILIATSFNGVQCAYDSKSLVGLILGPQLKCIFEPGWLLLKH
jgi:hypothetical protein